MRPSLSLTKTLSLPDPHTGNSQILSVPPVQSSSISVHLDSGYHGNRHSRNQWISGFGREGSGVHAKYLITNDWGVRESGSEITPTEGVVIVHV